MTRGHLKSNISASFTRNLNCKYLLITNFEVRNVSYGPSFFPPSIYGLSAKRAGHKSKGKKRRSVTYITDREDEVSKIFIYYFFSQASELLKVSQSFAFFTHPSTISQRKFISVHFKMARKVTVRKFN